MKITGTDQSSPGVVADIASLLADLGDASASTLGSIYAILGNPGTDDFIAVIGQLLDAAKAMNAASDGTDTLVTIARSILERIGETPADPDDSLHTIVGQRDATALDKNTDDDGTQSAIAILRSVVDRIGNVGTSDLDALLDSIVASIAAQDALVITERVVKTFTFTGAAGFGQASDVISLFTVTAGVDVSIEAFCTTNLTVSAGTTLEIGITGNTDFIIAQTDPTAIDANEVWHDATPDSTIELTSDASKDVTIYGSNIEAVVGAGGNITAGVIEFSVVYTKRTTNSLIEAA